MYLLSQHFKIQSKYSSYLSQFDLKPFSDQYVVSICDFFFFESTVDRFEYIFEPVCGYEYNRSVTIFLNFYA